MERGGGGAAHVGVCASLRGGGRVMQVLLNGHYGKVGAVQVGGHRAAAASSSGARKDHDQKTSGSQSCTTHDLQALVHRLVKMSETSSGLFSCAHPCVTPDMKEKDKAVPAQRDQHHL